MTKKQQIDYIRQINKMNIATPEDFDPHFTHMQSDSYVNKIKNRINEIIMIRERYLFVNRSSRSIDTVCSHCGHKDILKKVPKNRSTTQCTNCKSKLETRNVKFASHRAWTYREFIYFDNSTLSKNIIIAFQFGVTRTINGEFETIKVEDELKVVARYYFDFKSPNRMMVFKYWQSEWEFTKSIFQLNSAQQYYSGIERKSVFDAVKKSDEYKYLSVELLKQSNPMDLINLYCKYPNIELLDKIGLSKLICAKASGEKTYSTINWKGKTVQKMLKLNKAEIKLFMQITQKYFEDLDVFQILKFHGYKIEEEFIDARTIHNLFRGTTTSVKALLGIDRPSKILSYLTKQKELNSKTYYSLSGALGDFNDMITDMQKLSMDVSKKKIYPKNLNKRHQAIANMVTVKENKERDLLIASRASNLDKFTTHSNGYVIFPARSTIDLVNESKKLHHCVRTYAENYSKGKTNIFFLRKEDEQEKPLYTIEVDKKMDVGQCRGIYNCGISKKDEAAKTTLDEFKRKLKMKNKGEKNERIAN